MAAKDWSWTTADGTELRIMQLPDRRNSYIVLTDAHGMTAIARTMGDREAEALATWLDSVVNRDAAN
jgi:hypothetical protein